MKGFILETEEGVLFVIVPQDKGDWKIVERNKIIVAKDAQPGETREAFERRMRVIRNSVEAYRKKGATP